MTDEFQKNYAARAGIEGTHAQAISRCGLRRCRYIGLAKTHLQHIITAAAVNLIRIAEWHNARPGSSDGGSLVRSEVDSRGRSAKPGLWRRDPYCCRYRRLPGAKTRSVPANRARTPRSAVTARVLRPDARTKSAAAGKTHPRVRPRSAPGSLDVACRSALPR